MDGPFALTAQNGGAIGGGLVAFGIGEIAERAIDRAQPVGAGGDDHIGDGGVPHIAPMHLTAALLIRVCQDRIMGVHAADHRGARAHAGGVVGNPEMQALVALGSGGNFAHILHAQSGLNDVLKTDAFFVAFGVLNLGHHHVHRIDICRRPDLGDHDQIEALTGLFDDVNHVAIHVMGVQSVDSNRHGLAAPIDLIQGLDDVLARLFFLIRGDRIFEVEEDDIDIRLRCLFKHLRLTSGDGQFAAVQPAWGLFNGMKTHCGRSLRLQIQSGRNTDRIILLLSSG